MPRVHVVYGSLCPPIQENTTGSKSVLEQHEYVDCELYGIAADQVILEMRW